jgi:hypothetical protein
MFTPDSRTENYLNQMGVKWKYTNAIRFNNLVAGWDTKNIARPVVVRDDAVEEYAALTMNGSMAPAPILVMTQSGLDVVDGIQRLTAAQLCNETSISAYVLECDSEELIATLHVMSNARLQGRAEPMEWTRRRAVEILVCVHGMSCEEVAKIGGWRVQDIESISKAIEYRKAIESIGGPGNLPDSLLSVVSKNTDKQNLLLSGPVGAEFFEVLKRSGFSAEDAEPHIENFFQPISKVANCRKCYSDRLDEFLSDPDVEVRVKGRKGCVMPPDIKLRRGMKVVLGIIEDIKKSGNNLVGADEFFKLSQQIRDGVHELSSKHKKRVVVRVEADRYKL